MDRGELENLLADTGVTPTKRVLDALFEQFDTDGSGSFEYNEFRSSISKICPQLRDAGSARRR